LLAACGTTIYEFQDNGWKGENLITFSLPPLPFLPFLPFLPSEPFCTSRLPSILTGCCRSCLFRPLPISLHSSRYFQQCFFADAADGWTTCSLELDLLLRGSFL
jgi:hypothetical protein